MCSDRRWVFKERGGFNLATPVHGTRCKWALNNSKLIGHVWQLVSTSMEKLISEPVQIGSFNLVFSSALSHLTRSIFFAIFLPQKLNLDFINIVFDNNTGSSRNVVFSDIRFQKRDSSRFHVSHWNENMLMISPNLIKYGKEGEK